MRTTITLDDQLLKEAISLTGIQEKSALVNAALKVMIRRESASRLAKLGGTQPQLKPIHRQRQPSK